MKNWQLSSLVLFFALLVAGFYLAAALLPEDTFRPGGGGLYVVGIGGAVLFAISLSHFLAKRLPAPTGMKSLWKELHVICGSLGVAVVSIHPDGSLGKLPVLVLLAALGVLVTGLYGRLISSQQVPLRLGRNLSAFAPAREESMAPLWALINAKRSLVSALSEGAVEGEYSLSLGDWLRHPILSLRYQRLSLREEGLVRAAAGMSLGLPSLLQRYWRLAHLVFVGLLILGLLAHVIVVLFFAGYAAGGQEVYWWHLRS